MHRDAIGNYESYAPTVKINDEEAAQVMFVVGTNGGGLSHENWQQNLKFAVKIQEKAEEMYPRII
ncbi:Stage II sporulation protein P (SpoIIP) [compost metagenome]